MQFKSIKKSGVHCWSTSRAKPCIAVANSTQQFDTDFGSETSIELFDLNIRDSNASPSVYSTASTGNQTFTSICWHPDDKLLLGSKTGTIKVYNTADTTLGFVHETSPVNDKKSTINCLNVNTNEPSSICTGSDDGSVTIWKLRDSFTKTLVLSPTLSVADDAVVFVKWNEQIPSVLASVTTASVYIYDTRKQGQTAPIMQVCDNNSATVWGPGAASVIYPCDICWSKSQSTTLILGVANDMNPHLQLWDLRYTSSPVKYLQGGHTRGVSALAWNGFDESILISASKYNSLCFWNPMAVNGVNPLLSMLPAVTKRLISNITWCPWEPSLFAVSSAEEYSTVYNLTRCNYVEMIDEQSSYPQHGAYQHHYLQQILPAPPTWMKRPFGVSWAFGGKLITYSTSNEKHEIAISQVTYDNAFISRVEKINNAISNDNLTEYCTYKTSEFYSAKNEAIGLAWRLMSAHLMKNPTERLREVLLLLGYPNDKPINSFDIGSSQSPSLNRTNSLTNSYEEYDDRQTSSGRTTTTTSPERNPKSYLSLFQNQHQLKIETADDSIGSLINRSILCGNYEKALDACWTTNSWSEAFLLSWFLAPETLGSTIKQYFAHLSSIESDKFSALLCCLVSGRMATDSEKLDSSVLEVLVSKVDLKYWREVLVFIYKEVNDMDHQTFAALVDTLANRLLLQQQEDNNAVWVVPAMYCYILSKNYENIAKYCETLCGSFMNLVEIVLVLKKLSSVSTQTPYADALCARFAERLILEGKLEEALCHLQNTNDTEFKRRLQIHCSSKFNVMSRMNNNNSLYKKQFGRSQSRLSTVAEQPAHPPYQQSSLPARPSHTFPNQVTQISESIGISGSSQFLKRYASAEVNSRPPSVTPQYNIAPQLQQHQQPPPPLASHLQHGIGNMPNFTDSQAPPYMGPPAPQILYQQPPAATYALPPRRSEPTTAGWNDPPVIKQHTVKSIKPQPTPTSAPVALLNPSQVEVPQPIHPVTVSRRRRVSSDRISQCSSAVLELSMENQQMCSQYEALLQQLEQQLQIKSQIPPNLRRKLDDVRCKLDNLRIKLASEGQVSSSTIKSLNEMAQAISHGDFGTALAIHNHLVTATTFAETSDFLPGIKVLLHLLQQHRCA